MIHAIQGILCDPGSALASVTVTLLVMYRLYVRLLVRLPVTSDTAETFWNDPRTCSVLIELWTLRTLLVKTKLWYLVLNVPPKHETCEFAADSEEG